MTYEDLTINPWLQFNELVKRSLTFAVYVDKIDSATLSAAAAALEYSLDSIESVSIGVPEVGDQPVASMADGLARLDAEGETAMKVEGQLKGLDLSLYVTSTYVTAVVPAVTVMDDDPDPTTAPEDFKILVQFGLELCELLKAQALYLLDDDDEYRIPDEEGEIATSPDSANERGELEPIWQRDTA
jgi:hypothetical protein